MKQDMIQQETGYDEIFFSMNYFGSSEILFIFAVKVNDYGRNIRRYRGKIRV
jgi:hypothetical protein